MTKKDEAIKGAILLPYDEYQRLLKASEELQALYAGGVDNWPWYADALEEFNAKWYPDD